MRVMGIDPGVSGGLCIVDNGKIVGLDVMPILELKQKKTRKIRSGEKNEAGKKTKTYVGIVKQLDYPSLCNMFRKAKKMCVDKVYIERVHARPGEGVSSTFNFGVSYGSLLALSCATGIPYELVTPSVWTKQMWSGSPNNMEAKSRSILVASRLFPDVSFILDGSRTPHTGLVDSTLVAYYGYLKELNCAQN